MITPQEGHECMVYGGMYHLEHCRIVELLDGNFSRPFAKINFYNAKGELEKKADLVPAHRLVSFGMAQL